VRQVNSVHVTVGAVDNGLGSPQDRSQSSSRREGVMRCDSNVIDLNQSRLLRLALYVTAVAARDEHSRHAANVSI